MSDPREALASFIRWVMRDTRYHALYAATVEGQAADDTLDLRPDDESIRGQGLSGVPIRHGLPGVRVRVGAGARVKLGFENGDPAKPYAALWEPGAIESLEFDGGTRQVARVGDPVTVFFPPTLTVTGTLLGGAFAGVITITSPGVGIIDSGAARVKA